MRANGGGQETRTRAANSGGTMHIRPYTPADYPALADISTAAQPDSPATAQEIEFWDTHRDPRCRFARWVAEREGVAVGFGLYSQNAGMYHPQRFHIGIRVRPEYQGQGIGRALYGQIMDALGPLDPLSLRAEVRENEPRPLRFLSERGFAEGMRAFESWLDVAAFDPAPWANAVSRAEAQGYALRTLREMEDAPGHWPKLYELAQELNADVPAPEPHTRVAKDVWLRRLRESPRLLPEAYFIATRGDEYVGVTMLFAEGGGDDLSTGLTGVLAGHRRRGLALALKLRAIAWAQAQDRPRIKTWNEQNNRGMLGINTRLGFVRRPAWLDMVKHIKEEDQ